MKRAYIIHGWGGSPRETIHQWIKKELEKKGFDVVAPEMPNTDEPEINAWVGKLLEIIKNPDEETILIGHSIGCQTILRYLEKIPEKTEINKIILIAPWMHLDEETIKEEGEEGIEIARPWIETPIDFEKVKKHCNNFHAIFSDNDPFVPLSDEKIFKKELNAKTQILHNKGHFTEGDGVKEIPEVLEILEK